MAEFKISSLRFTFVGAWLTATTYKKDDVVSYAGKLYTVENAYTSADVYSDIAAGNLSLTFDGKSFKGTWTADTYYDLNDIVTLYPDINAVFVCNTPHTSASTFSETNWDLLVEYSGWSNAWAGETDYNIGSIVKYGANVYKATADHTSAVVDYSLTILNLTVSSGTATITFASNGNSGLVADIGSTITLASVTPSSFDGSYTITGVTNTSITFLCSVVDSWANGGTATGLNNADWGGLEADQSSWDLYFAGVEYRGAYQGGSRYRIGDLIKIGASVYKCTVTHTSALVPVVDLTKFEIFAEGLRYKDAWSSATAYNPGAVVTYGGYVYLSTAFNNIANVPVVGSIYWEIFNRGYEFKNEWSIGEAYKVGSVVRRNANLYVSIVDNLGQDPMQVTVTTNYAIAGSFDTTVKVQSVNGIVAGMVVSGNGFTQGQTVVSVTAPDTVVLNIAPDGSLFNGQQLTFILSADNTAFWDLIASSVNWRNFWTNNTTYFVNDVVVRGNVTYQCVKNHTSTAVTSNGVTTGNRPDIDTNDHWAVYLKHAPTNVLTEQGDIKVFDQTGIVALAIPTESGLSLQSNGVTATWAKTFVSPNLFYVSNDIGQDNAVDGYGTTWDKPFSTIAYACDHVNNGVLFSNAAVALRSNKSFIVEEVIQRMNYLMAQSTPPYDAGSVWDETKSRRDVQLIIDAIIYDLTRGGNSQTVAAALSFFKLGSETEWFNYATESASEFIVDSLTYVYTSLLGNVLSSQPPAISYQTLMAVAVPINQSFIGSVDNQATTDTLSLFNLLLNALTIQNTSKLPPPNQGVSATINIKTGTYRESNLPIVVPANCCLVGDELRGVTVEPEIAVNTIVTRSFSSDNTLEAYTTANMSVGTPIVFITSNAFGATSVEIQRFEANAIAVGVTYYVKTVESATRFTIATGTIQYAVTVSGPQASESGNKYNFDSVYRATPNLMVGYTYVFDQSNDTNVYWPNASGTNVNPHPMNFSADNLSGELGGGTSYLDGVEYRLDGAVVSQTVYNSSAFNTAVSRQVQITVTSDTPAILYYWCYNHQAMGNSLSIVATGPNSSVITLSDAITMSSEIGTMLIYGGEALGSMFFMRNGTGLRNMTLSGLLGTLGPINNLLTQRPTGGAYVSLDPGTGPDDSEAWIIRRSPYVQNVTTLGIGCVGLKIDGTLHNGGNKSIVCNDYTHLLSDGIGVWCTGSGSLCEAVSVFSYYGYAGYLSDAGGRIRATNGNSSYGTFGVIAEGFDITETPIEGNVFNRQDKAQANIGFVDNETAGILNYTFDNAGQDHNNATVNLLSYSNSFEGASWINDGNVVLTQGTVSPDGLSTAWILTSTTANSDSAHLSQNISIVPSDGFANPNQSYTVSVHLKYNSSLYTDIHAIFTGTSTRSSGVRIAWNNTPTLITVDANGDGGFNPTSYGIVTLPDGWYRVWFVVYDTAATNTSLQLKLYPRGKDGAAGSVYVYGTQVENGDTLRFYVDNRNTIKHSASANFVIIGNGSNAVTVGDETRGQAVFETRIIDNDDGYGVGGQNYLVSANSAQTGNDYTITIANAYTNLATNYIGLSLYVTAGTGVGQYGYISNYNAVSKVVNIVKQSFEPLAVAASTASGNVLSLDVGADFDSLYLNQPIQFLPNYYNTTALATSQDYIEVTASTGGQTNTFTVASTARLSLGMAITFSGTVFGGVIQLFTYYVTEILDSTTIKISTRLFGTTLFLNTATGSMTLNYGSNTNFITAGSTDGMTPNLKIQFSGFALGGIAANNIYFIHDIIDATTFTISESTITVTATATTAGTNVITVSSSTGLRGCNPIVFAGTNFGNIVAGTKYYIADVVGTSITITDTLIEAFCTEATAGTQVFTVDSSTDFVIGHPVVFYGNVFGGVISETVYYVLDKPSSTTITITAARGSTTPVTLNTATGFMFVRTASAPITLTTASGTLIATAPGLRTRLTSESGSMSVLYQTSLFGGVVQGTTYFVLNKIAGTPNQLTITATDGGTTPVTIVTNNGLMSLVASGWDNVVPGKPNVSLLDTGTFYFIEPRLTYTAPPFTQVSQTLPSVGGNYATIAYGNGHWLALGTNEAVAKSVDGTTWTNLNGIGLPTATWTGLSYGNKYWVALRSNSSSCYYSNDNGVSWLTGSMPSVANWSHIAFGNNTFIAIDNTSNSAKIAYSTSYGKTWTAATLSLTPADGWRSIAHGAGTFVAIPNGNTNTASYSLDFGATWATATLPRTTTWQSVAYGNGRFVAVSSASGTAAYSFDGISWLTSLYNLAATRITYGQGVFVALPGSGTIGYTTEDGQNWKTRAVTNTAYVGMAFGYDSNYVGKWVTVAGTTVGSIIQAGARARSRSTVLTAQLFRTIMLEPGSNYVTSPTLNIFDPNETLPATPQVRIANGVLANPTFIARGSEYATNNTVISVLADGFADRYQTDLFINLENISSLPSPGDSLNITGYASSYSGSDTIYRITSAVALNGTVAPNLTVRVGLSPAMSYFASPDHGTTLIIRKQFSQVRLTNHDFLNIGFGDKVDSNYPLPPTNTIVSPQNQTVENNYGRVFYTSTDQDGNFKVGELFGVEQATGIVTVSATQFGLSGLNALELGGISVGNVSVVITQFSTDPTFIANSDNILSTQRAVRGFIEARLSQGGANTFTGNTTAGTVSIGAPNIIASSLPPGSAGSTIRIPTVVRIGGAGVDGDMMAQAFFASAFHRPTRVF